MMTTSLCIKVTDILFYCCMFSTIKPIIIKIDYFFLAIKYEMPFSIIIYICMYSPYKDYGEFYITDLNRSCFLVMNSQKESFDKLSM